MIVDDRTHRDAFAKFRNPRSTKVGYHIGDELGLCQCEFKWFDSVGDLIHHVLNVELPSFAYDQDDQDNFRRRIARALRWVAVEGLSEEARADLNQVDWGCTMYWWGSLEDLLSGKTQFSREVLGSFAVKRGGGSGVMAVEIPAFVEFLRCCCKSDGGPGKAPSSDNSPPYTRH